MRKNLIKKLTERSYSRNHLDSGKVAKISRSLKREDLKVYIKNLKTAEAKKTVIITLPTDKGLRELKKYFAKLYPSKRLIFKLDESLLMGIKVVDYDNIYELSLKSFLEKSLKGALND